MRRSSCWHIFVVGLALTLVALGALVSLLASAVPRSSPRHRRAGELIAAHPPPVALSPAVPSWPPCSADWRGGVHLISTYFDCANRTNCSALRMREQLTALEFNLRNPYINCVHLLSEGAGVRLPTSPKLRRIAVDSQPTYRRLFAHANSLPSVLIAIANADIYFDETLRCALANREMMPARLSPDPNLTSSRSPGRGGAGRHAPRRRTVYALSRSPAPRCVADDSGRELNRTRSANRDHCAQNHFSFDVKKYNE